MPQEAHATADDNASPPPPTARLAAPHAHLDEKGALPDEALKPTTVSGRRPGVFSRVRLLGAVDKDSGDGALLVHSFVTGMVDAGSFANWGVFVGMQTGNTVILGLSTAELPNNPHAWTTTLVSLASFLVGAFLTFRLTQIICPKGATSNRLYLSAIYLVQALLIIISAALITANLVPHNRPGMPDESHISGILENVKIVALLPPLGFQSGMQIATSRLLGFNELPVNVLTSTYCDLMGDAKLFAMHNVKRNRRAIAVVLLLAGAISSGWLMRSSAGLKGVLWLAGGIKLLVAVFTLFFQPALKG